MSRIRKKFERILNNPKDIKWDELISVLKSFDLICIPPTTGSHWTVYHDGSNTNLTIPVHNNRVKAIYVKKLIALIEYISEEE